MELNCKQIGRCYLLHNFIKNENTIAAEKSMALAMRLLPLILYLCSEEPDILINSKKPFFEKPKPKKTKKGIRYFDAEKTSNYEVGYRIGRFIREYKKSEKTESMSGGKSKSPHIRKAHFHLYWTGKGREIPLIKWLPPIPINIENEDDMLVSIKNIK